MPDRPRRPAARAAHLEPVALGHRALEDLRSSVAPTALEAAVARLEHAAEALAGRRVWVVNSTARGGGVAEMTRTLMPYWRGGGLDVRWLVLRAPAPYFAFTKRLHNLLHGVAGRRPSPADARLFDRVAADAGTAAAALVAPGDVVLLEDPQTAGLAAPLVRAGACVVWRCHVGPDRFSAPVQAAWAFLAPYVAPAAAYVFARRAFVPSLLDPGRVRILSPAIDPCSVKNRPLGAESCAALLRRAGLVDRRADGPRLGRDRLVVALGRWDRLKDPVGILEGFAEHVRDPRAALVLAGPAPDAVSDDPEDRDVIRAVMRAWRGLPRSRRARIEVAMLPMHDLARNALTVNALQRSAAVVVKKSLEEGFGLGVTEGMWKARPVLATRVGGHRDQILDGATGVFLDDPRDLAGFGAAIDELLDDPGAAAQLGHAARESVRRRYLADRHAARWMSLLTEVVASERAPAVRRTRHADPWRARMPSDPRGALIEACRP